MIWKKITIETLSDASDIVASVLFDNGICGAEIDDNKNLTDYELEKMYVDIPKLKEDDGKAKVSFYISLDNEKKNIDANIDKNIVDDSYKMSTDNIFTKNEFDNIMKNILIELDDYKSFMNMGTLEISEEELDDNIFLNKWKENFKRLDIDNISIIPSFDKDNINKIDNHINVYIEPGNAFGTGQHATTKLCIKAIEKLVKDKKLNSIMDVGCGSGILGIVAKKLGIKTATFIDIDKDVEFNLLENMKLNNISVDNINYYFGNIINDDIFRKKIKPQKYDIVVANILAPVIISLLTIGKIDEYICGNGYFICSGIIREKAENVRNTILKSKKYELIDTYYEDDWVAFIIKRKS